MSKALKLIFLASIVLNVLFVGVILGQLPNRLDSRSSSQQRIETATKQIPEPARSRFRDRMEQIRKEVQPLRDEIRAARNETIRLFVAEPFDEAAFDRQVIKISKLRVELSQHMATSMKELAKELPAQQRQTLAEAFKRPPRSFR